MSTRISPRDWEAISIYLDGQLNAKERSRLEMRLQDEPDLQEALISLKRTRMILRSAPKLRAPRNFTLTENMAGVRKQDAIQPGAYPILRLSSILATVFLVVITIGSLTVKSFQPEQAIVMQSEYQAEAPALLLGAGAGSDVPVQEAEPISPEQTIAAKRGLEGSSQETFSIAATPISPPDEKPTAEIMTAMEAPEERTIKDNSLDLEAPQVSSAQRSEASARRLSVRNLLTVFQIALALIALLTGAIALYLRRRPYL